MSRAATRAATAAVLESVRAHRDVSLEDAQEVLAAQRAIEANPQVKAALADPVAQVDAKATLAERVFASLSPVARSIVVSAAQQRWSAADDLLTGLEQAGMQLAAHAAGDADLAGELHSVQQVVGAHPELELALGSALGSAEKKSALVERLLGTKANAATVTIVSHLVQSPRGRRIGALLRAGSDAVASAAGREIATVTTAQPLPAAQLDRLASSLNARYGRTLQLQQIVDPSIIGGLKVSVADEVVDGTLRSKFNDLRLQLG